MTRSDPVGVAGDRAVAAKAARLLLALGVVRVGRDLDVGAFVRVLVGGGLRGICVPDAMGVPFVVGDEAVVVPRRVGDVTDRSLNPVPSCGAAGRVLRRDPS